MEMKIINIQICPLNWNPTIRKHIIKSDLIINSIKLI